MNVQRRGFRVLAIFAAVSAIPAWGQDLTPTTGSAGSGASRAGVSFGVSNSGIEPAEGPAGRASSPERLLGALIAVAHIDVRRLLLPRSWCRPGNLLIKRSPIGRGGGQAQYRNDSSDMVGRQPERVENVITTAEGVFLK
jgi:hypothetical protein